jgi:hypothetical protein
MRYAAKLKAVTAMGNVFYRIVLAHYNRARYDVCYEEYVQSFAPCYIIDESGDYVTPPDDDTIMEQLGHLVWLRGIDTAEIEWY